MVNELIQSLEKKIDKTIETIELLRMQIEDLEEQNCACADLNTKLQADNEALKASNISWERNINNLLNKLGTIEATTTHAPQEAAKESSTSLEVA